MRVLRAALVAVVVMDLALLAVWAPHRDTLRRYDLARRQREVRELARENLALLNRVAAARRPESVAARAAAFGIDLHVVDQERIDRPAEPSPPGRKAIVRAPRP